jgi:hypothetical protein
MTHNDQAVRLAVGDVAFVDAAQPVTYFADNKGAAWNTVTLNLPRKSLVSHLGFEPKGGIYRRGGTLAGRLLFDLIQEADRSEGSAFSPADSYMQLAVYDLVGALFAPSDPWPVSRHADKLFARICGVIKDGFSDPDFGPVEVAAEAGSRYVTFKSSLRSAAPPAANSSIRVVWTTPHVFYTGVRCWVQASLSARSPMPAAFAIMHISRENSAIGLVTRRAPTRHGQSASDRTVRAGTVESASLAHDVQPPAT